MNRPSRAGTSLAVVVALLAAVLVPLIVPTTAGATGSPTATIKFADGSSSSSAQVGDEIALDLTISNCTSSTSGNFTLRAAFENWTTFPVGPSWTGGTTYGADWPKVTNGTGLVDGVYRLYFTVPSIADGAHNVQLWWLQGVNCYGGGGWSDAISLYVGTPAPTTTTSTTTTSTTVPPTTTTSTTVPPTTEPPSTTVPPTTTTSTTVPPTTTTTVPPTTTPRSSTPTTVAPRSLACPERRPYRIYNSGQSRGIGAYLVARCGYRTEWRRVPGTMGAFAVPTEWAKKKAVPQRWWF